MKRPVAETVPQASHIAGVPEVIGLTYDLWTLRIALQFVERDGPVYVEFHGVQGFRVLDEGALGELWDSEVRVDGWLWRLHGGGWLDLERMRPEFVPVDHGLLEFLVGGENECVSVLAHDSPRIHDLSG